MNIRPAWLYIPCAAAAAVLLILQLWLTPQSMLDIVNNAQPAVIVTTRLSSGGPVTGWRFEGLSITDRRGVQVAQFDDLGISPAFLPLLAGRMHLDIRSPRLSGWIEAGPSGIIGGKLALKELPLDSQSLGLPDSFAFATRVTGSVVIGDDAAESEFLADGIDWRRLDVEGVPVPTSMLGKARGGIRFERGKAVIRSIGFEGDQGFARLAGTVAGGRTDVGFELYPKDWRDPLLVPLARYKTAGGSYRIPLAIALDR